MKIVDAGQHATGFFAFGQEATGFIAIGQVATGVIAVGQLARGGFCVGQVTFGLVGWGQVGGGIFHAAGMVGVGGRRGIGGIIPLVPSLGRPRVLPEATTLPAIEAGGEGWIEADLGGDLSLYQGGARLPIKLDRRLQKGVLSITEKGPRRVRAYTRRVGNTWVCERIAHEPPRPYQKAGFGALAAIQIAGLLCFGTAYAAVVGHDLLVGLGKVFMDAPATMGDTPKPPGPAPRPPRPRR